MKKAPKAAKKQDAVLKKILSAIRGNKKFAMIAHESPDGDSLGSAMAMTCALRKMGKDVCLLTDMVPEKYRYLPLASQVLHALPKDMGERVGLVFDTPTPERLGSLKHAATACRMLINIDHHVSNLRYAGLNWIDTAAASVGEQVHALLKALRVKINKDIACCVYTAMVTDTGKFQYSNTSPRTHRIAEELLSTGIDHQRISEAIYDDYPQEKLALLSRALGAVHLICGGKAAWVAITQGMLRESGASMEWTDDVINFLRGIRGVEAVAVFKETEDPRNIKVSFRSRNPKVDVNTIAGKFGGGGHCAASGCTLLMPLNEATGKVLEEFQKIYGPA